MKTAILVGVAMVVTADVTAQGYILFQNRVVAQNVDAKLVHCAGQPLPGGGVYTVELLAGRTAASLAPAIDDATGLPIRMPVTLSSGYFAGGRRGVRGIPAGVDAFFQVRCYSTAAGSFAASGNCGGVSEVFSLRLTEPPAAPAAMVGLDTIALSLGCRVVHITQWPVSQTVACRDTATFRVSAWADLGSLSYGWAFFDTNSHTLAGIAGATGPELTLDKVGPAQAGEYFVIVWGSCGEYYMSNAFTLTVVAGEPPQLSIVQKGSQARLTWPASACARYTLEDNNSLSSTFWGPCTNAVITLADQDYVATVPIAGATKFYRVRGEPQPSGPSGMVLIPGGSFQMGDSVGDGWDDEFPVHTVMVSGFYMDKYEVSKALWDEVYQWAIGRAAELRYSIDNAGFGKAANHPVHTVNWYDMVKWCNARSEREGRVPAYYTSAAQATVYRTGQLDVQNDWVKWNSGYRLPTEAEWEYAARGGLSGRRFPCGDTISHSQANYLSVSSWEYDISPTRRYHPTYETGEGPYTSPVGSFGANGYGLHDMAGNVWEWCWDWYGSYRSSPSSDPRGPATGSDRVIRGGGWSDCARQCRVSDRGSWPDYFSLNGFRSVLPPGQ